MIVKGGGEIKRGLKSVNSDAASQRFTMTNLLVEQCPHFPVTVEERFLVLGWQVGCLHLRARDVGARARIGRVIAVFG